MTRHTLLSALFIGGSMLAATQALAQTPVEAVEVTVSRLPAPLAVTPDAYVVTEGDIARRGSAFATDVLAEVPGVSISENGPFGGVSSLRLRGASADKTLVLIDGVPVNDPSQPAGGYDFSGLDAADISRIEVLTGPQGALWGSDAIGGVVSITTREPSGVNAYAEGGSLTTTRGGLSLGHAEDRYAFGLAVSTFKTDGISKADEKDGNSELDGYATTTVSANARLSLSDRVSLDARARFNTAGTEYDGFGGKTGVIDSNDSSDVTSASGYARLSVKNLLGFDQQVRVDLMSLDRQYHGAYPFGAQGGQQVYRWSATRQEKTWGLDVGAEQENASENTGDGVQTRDRTGVYAIGRWAPDPRLTLTVSLRRDEVQGYQGQTTGRAALAYDLGAGFTLQGSAGQGFKAPSIYETTYPCFECTVLGPPKGLRPERAEGYDGGLAWRSAGGRLQLEATLFTLNVRDQINYLYPTGYMNIDRVRSSGVEVGGKAMLAGGFSLSGSWTHDDAVDGTGARLLKVPRDTGSASVGWQGHGLTADLGLRGQTAAPDVYGTIRPFAVAWANVSYALTKQLALTGRVENLADSHYQEAYGYGEPGRMILVGLRWTE